MKYAIGDRDRDEEIAKFICERTAMDLGDTPYTCIGQIDQSGVLVGGVLFNNYTQRDIHAHIAGDGQWLSRRFLGECFRYVFHHLGCDRVTGLVAASNSHALDFDQKLGFIYEGTLRRYLPGGEDCIVLGMLREECRWLNVGVLSNGRKQRQSATTAASHQRTGPAAAPVYAGLRQRA
jgi:RimJ/RimL family protein N-acetyltransferase